MSVRGINELAEIIDLMKNPAKYDAKIAELRGEIGRYHEAIESVTKLSEVNEYTLNIKAKSQQLDEAYAKAQVDAAKLVSDAQAEAKALKEKQKAALDLVKAREDKVKAGEDQLAAASKKLAEDQQAVSKKTQELLVKEKELKDLESELAERKVKLLAAFA